MKKTFLITISLSVVLSGCVPLVVGGAAVGVATTASVIHDRRTAGTIVDNKNLVLLLESKIGNDKALYDNSHVNVNVYSRTVLLTGEAANQRVKEQIEQLVRANLDANINRVANYIIIGEKSTFSNRVFDSKITGKVKTVLTDVNVSTFDASRVKVVTEHGVVYLMGIVSEQEANAVIDVARRVEDVQQVVTLFEIDNTIAEPQANFNVKQN